MSEEYEGVDLPEQISVRMEKREQLNKLGDAYPVSLPITHTIEATKASAMTVVNTFWERGVVSQRAIRRPTKTQTTAPGIVNPINIPNASAMPHGPKSTGI